MAKVSFDPNKHEAVLKQEPSPLHVDSSKEFKIKITFQDKKLKKPVEIDDKFILGIKPNSSKSILHTEVFSVKDSSYIHSINTSEVFLFSPKTTYQIVLLNEINQVLHSSDLQLIFKAKGNKASDYVAKLTFLPKEFSIGIDNALEVRINFSDNKGKPILVNDDFILNVHDNIVEENVIEESFKTINQSSVPILLSDTFFIKAGHKYEIKLFNSSGKELASKNFEPKDHRTSSGVVRLETPFIPETEDENLWRRIRDSDLSFNKYRQALDSVLPFLDENAKSLNKGAVGAKKRLPFTNVEEYSLLKFATDIYMKKNLGIPSAGSYFNSANNQFLPYYQQVSDGLDDIIEEIENDVAHNPSFDKEASPIFQRISSIVPIELIWSYWMEQGMLVQTTNAISLRFQNIKGVHEVEPLGRFDTGPLRGLSQLLWGYIQDEQHTISLPRRVNEYDHEYGLRLLGRAVPRMQNVDSRSKFLEVFHSLLNKCAIFFKELDDTTRKADGFPIYVSLKELHLLLAEGNHNAYQNLTWSVRHEMLIQQYILSRQEMREFLGGRPMMPYQEAWMDKVDTMKMLQGWDPTSIIHYYDLAVCGEKLLLGVRYGSWNEVAIGAPSAANWAIAFRNHIQKYIHAYNTVTGVDLSADTVDVRFENRGVQPALLIQGRARSMAQTQQTFVLQERIPMRRY